MNYLVVVQPQEVVGVERNQPEAVDHNKLELSMMSG